MSSPLRASAESCRLHRLVWDNRTSALETELNSSRHDVEEVDPRGRTPLHLAVTLGHIECARLLLKHGANVAVENRQGWSVLQEAVSTGDPDMVQLILQHRDYRRVTRRLAGIPELMAKLRKATDFYVEMKWEFTSWVPLVSRVCPSDVYKVWKCGSNLRVDTTLLGFDHMTWQRGKRSFIFKGQDNGAVVLEVDHDRCLVYVETLSLAAPETDALLQAVRPSEAQLLLRLSSPVVSTHVNTKNIQFERNKSGIWGWRSEKSETINGYETKHGARLIVVLQVYSASHVELVTCTRTEHLSDQDKNKTKGVKTTPLQSFLGIAEQHVGSNNVAQITQMASPTNPTAITAAEYFNPRFALGGRDIGRPVELTVKTQRFKANLWLCENHPLSLVEQVMPIVDLMAISYTHFAKLRDFITLKLPSGFPVKIEIPLFHILNARITFGNLNGSGDEALSACGSPDSDSQSSPSSDNSSLGSINSSGSESWHKPHMASTRGSRSQPAPVSAWVMDDSVFEVPKGYTVAGQAKRQPMRDEDDALLQFAIRQSLLEAGTESDQVTIWEALTNSKPGTHPLSCNEGNHERLRTKAQQVKNSAACTADGSVRSSSSGGCSSPIPKTSRSRILSAGGSNSPCRISSWVSNYSPCKLHFRSGGGGGRKISIVANSSCARVLTAAGSAQSSPRRVSPAEGGTRDGGPRRASIEARSSSSSSSSSVQELPTEGSAGSSRRVSADGSGAVSPARGGGSGARDPGHAGQRRAADAE
ncbi:ankyrin repeat domain-containing protein 13B-like isoform X1 [Petromyzon marinus]|uniref:ankyrin repeat domain-containing protein 13B-like isoform X1 n=1 Tax=Petromyzon marinus TaxID=7757 RepID=UPI003F72702D